MTTGLVARAQKNGAALAAKISELGLKASVITHEAAVHTAQQFFKSTMKDRGATPFIVLGLTGRRAILHQLHPHAR